MPAPWPKFARTSTVVASPALAAETVIATVTIPATEGASEEVYLNGQANLTVGTSGTAVRMRWRQGNGITGTVVGDTGAVTGGVAAGNVVSLDVNGLDAPGEVEAFVYSLTLQVTAGAAASTVSGVSCFAMVAPQ